MTEVRIAELLSQNLNKMVKTAMQILNAALEYVIS